VRVAVNATTVNRTDCGARAAKPFFIRALTGLLRPRATILGNEFAGVVESVGPRVTRFAVGDRVFGYSRRFGAHAELLSIPPDGLVALVPAGLSFADVVPGTEGAHYALSIIRKAGISGGQDVLVNGATGAIGSAAVQLLADLGVRVTAVCGAAHVELVRGLGAERVIDRDAVDFTKEDHQYDVVFDAVGKSSIRRCRSVLKPHGLFLTTDLGPWSQNLLLPVVTRLARGRRVMLPSRSKTRRSSSTYATASRPGGSARCSTGATRWSRSSRPTGMSRPDKRSATSPSLWRRRVSALRAIQLTGLPQVRALSRVDVPADGPCSAGWPPPGGLGGTRFGCGLATSSR